MLALLTGDIQTGKTRWLEARVEAAEAAGVEVWGVLAPGVWVPREPGAPRVPGSGDGDFEKLGIDMAYFPGRERRVFAQRADLAGGSVRAITRQADIAYSYDSGKTEYDEIVDPLPFDVNAPIVKVDG